MAPGGAALLLATLSLAILFFPAASSASSPPIAGLSPTASAASTSTTLVVTRLTTTDTDDASASPSSPPAWTRTRSAEAAAPPPVVDAASPPPPPVADEPYRDATSPSPPAWTRTRSTEAAAPPPVGNATTPPPPPVAARVVSSSSATGDDLGLQQIAKVLASLGYNEMASSATILADSTPDVTWPGAITVFGAPDVFLHHSCPECSRSRRHLLLDHMALGYFPYAELAAAPAMNLPSAYAGFCLRVAAQPQRGPFSVHHASLYINGVMVSEPELYDDGRYVVHGLHGFIPPLSRASCVEDAHAHHHHGARSAATVVRFMIRQATSRLRDSGFGFVALAMRVKYFPELEKLSNLTVFALDDQVIFTGGGHGYVSAVRFHIVPGHRLTRADLLLLRPGTILPTLAGEDQKLVVTLGATDEVRVNYVPVKEPDVVINSRVAVHGIYLPFPRLHLAASASPPVVAALSPIHPVLRRHTTRSPSESSNATVASAIKTTTPTSTSSSSSPRRIFLILSLAGILAATVCWLAVGRGSSDGEHKCQCCFFEKPVFLLRCCKETVCNLCLRDFVKDKHKCKGLAAGMIVPLLHPHQFGIGGDVPDDYAHLPQYPPWYFVNSVKKNSRLHLFYYHLDELEGGAEPRVMEVIHHLLPLGELSEAIRCDIYPRRRPFSEL